MLDTRVQATKRLSADYLAQLASALLDVPFEKIEKAVDVLIEARALGRRVYVMGNGGSAATASHFANDLAKTARVEGFAPIRAFALTDNVPVFTAWANDASYEHVFAEQVAGLVDPGDVVIGITASGNSPNILAGLRAAADRGATTIGLVGFAGGIAKGLVDVPIHVAVADYGIVEDAHLAVCHAVMTSIRGRLLASFDR